MTKKQPKLLEVLPAVRKEPDGKWYVACTLVIDGKVDKQALYTEVGFKNMRRAKQFARTVAGIMETQLKREMLQRALEMGEGLVK